MLVVDDSRAQRLFLGALLTRWGYDVLEAGSASEALTLCDEREIDIILSDWMMPGMDGLQLCQALRARDGSRYVYFILLTSRSETADVTQGLDIGADDFLTKPVDPEELHARIAAGERILKVERELIEKNALLEAALGQIERLYAALGRDLVEARRLQQSLVPERHRTFETAELALLLRPSGHVGGDLCGQFSIDERRIGIFSIDVSGHGIASALLTARVAGHLTGASPERNIALVTDERGVCRMRPPAEVCAILNRILLGDMETDHYLTMVIAEADLATGRVELAQAGHPHPILLRAGGGIEHLGAGGLPVGLLPEATWESVTVELRPGDRLMLYTDGLTECSSPDGRALEEDELAGLLRRNASRSGPEFLDALERDLQRFIGDTEFPDDISAVVLSFHGKT